MVLTPTLPVSLKNPSAAYVDAHRMDVTCVRQGRLARSNGSGFVDPLTLTALTDPMVSICSMRAGGSWGKAAPSLAALTHDMPGARR
jgi:hypothetical protein